jgi:hypothetical protein
MTDTDATVTPLHPADPSVIRPGAFTVEATCPECDRLVRFPIELFPRLSVDQNGGKLRIVMSGKALEHSCTVEDGEPLF